MYRRVTNCRACGAGRTIYPSGIKAETKPTTLKPVFSLGLQPLANDFVEEGEEHQGFAPLEVLLCPDCGLAQLSVVVKPEILYGGQYRYVTSKSEMMRAHFNRLLLDCSKLAPVGDVMEIGSNDGHFLEYCRDTGAACVVGIDPAENLAAQAESRRVNMVRGFFGTETAKMARSIMVPDIIFARHVFCHVGDWKGFFAGLEIAAGPATLICIEVPYVGDQLKANSFDQIYHEHLSFLSIRAFVNFLDKTPFELQSVVRYPIHGGAIALMVRRRELHAPLDDSVRTFLNAEDCGEDAWRQFGDRCRDQIACLKSYVRDLSASGKRVVGFGASAKSTVWINACGFTRNEVRAVYDCTPEKWYRLIPGTDIPVANEGAFYVDNADYAVLFAWNYLEEVRQKHQKWLQGGGKFIVPVPSMRVIGVDSDTGGA